MIRPVSGRKPFVGSSVVIRHCSAAPRSRIVSWLRPRSAEGLAGRDPQLGLHEVDVGDLLGHGVLDLDPRVHLDEVVVALGAEQELHGAGVAVADLGREPHRVGAHPLADVGVEVGRRGDLDDLLVPPLDRAVALEEVDHVALGVGEDLHLDVPRVDHGLLDEDGRVAERALGLAHAGVDRVLEVLLLVHLAHAASATAGDGLDEEGVVQPLGGFHQLVEVVVGRHRLERRYAGRPWPPRSPAPCCRSA